ncbi:MAG TPA: hypothetical protein VD866_26790 [Urbifossiella sp.]|nr:hypothetical protein [Urbifossiella sp.]
MPDFTPDMSADYLTYIEGQVRRHFLLADGKAQGDEVGEIEDHLSDLWEGLDEVQRQSVKGVGSDLNWIRRRGAPAPKSRTADDVTQEEMQRLQDAQDAEDWHKSLHFLRVCGPNVPRDLLAYVRATCYFKLNLSQIALLLADLAVELDSGEYAIGRPAFEALQAMMPERAFFRANEVMAAPNKHSPLAVVQSIGFIFDTLGSDAGMFDGNLIAKAIADATERLDTAKSPDPDRAHFYYLAGAEMHAFGREAEAIKMYEAGLNLEPKNPALLAGLGMALYTTNKSKAVSLFQGAVLHGAQILRPYMHLAHHHLMNREFAKAFGYARNGMRFARNPRAQAAILEIMGISANELGHSPETVLQLFTEASRLAPESARLAANLKAYEESGKGRQAKADWLYREEREDYVGRELIVAKSRDEAFARV